MCLTTYLHVVCTVFLLWIRTPSAPPAVFPLCASMRFRVTKFTFRSLHRKVRHLRFVGPMDEEHGDPWSAHEVFGIGVHSVFIYVFFGGALAGWGSRHAPFNRRLRERCVKTHRGERRNVEKCESDFFLTFPGLHRIGPHTPETFLGRFWRPTDIFRTCFLPF